MLAFSPLSSSTMNSRESKKIRKEEDNTNAIKSRKSKSLLKQVEIQNLKMKIIENYEKKQWTIDYSPYKLKIIPPQDSSMSFSGLSDEIITMIYSYLDSSDVLEMLCLSKEHSKFSLNYLYENPKITSLSSLTLYLEQLPKIRIMKPLTLPVSIKSLTLTGSFYNEIIRNLNSSNYIQCLIQKLNELFQLCHQTLYTLSINFNIDAPGEFQQLFISILQNYTFDTLNTLRLKNPTKETLNYLLVCMPHLNYLCQDHYTNAFYVSANEIFSLDPACQNNIRNIYYTLGEPLDSFLKQSLQSENLGLWRMILNRGGPNELDISEKNLILSRLIENYPNALSVNLNQNMNNETLMALSRCTHLVELQLHNGDFNSFGLCHFFSSLSSSTFNNLSFISLDYCPGVNDEVIQLLTLQFPKLTTLSVNHCKWVTDCSMQYISKRLTGLKKLEISGTRLTSVGLWQLSSLYYLSQLNLTQCYNLSLESLIEFIKITYSFFFSVSCLSQQEKYKNGWIGMDDSLFYEIPEELNVYAMNEIERLKDLQNNYKMYQMQNDISCLNINSNHKKETKYKQRSISNIFLSYSKK